MDINIPNILYKSIKEYCEYNNIIEIDKEIVQYIQVGFNIKRFGISPFKTSTVLPKDEKPKKIKKEKTVEVDEPTEQQQTNTVEEVPQETIETPRKKIRIIKK